MHTRFRGGFTLVELLVVVVVIGVLAAMAIPRFQTTKGKANFAALRSDLHNLGVTEESYFADHQRYSTSLDSLGARFSPGVVLEVKEASLTGWSATAYHPTSYPRLCAIYFGTASAVAPATAPGAVACN
jgi:type IV pilus assembly protein PilA